MMVGRFDDCGTSSLVFVNPACLHLDLTIKPVFFRIVWEFILVLGFLAPKGLATDVADVHPPVQSLCQLSRCVSFVDRIWRLVASMKGEHHTQAFIQFFKLFSKISAETFPKVDH